jgi:DMSO/TMAO reductase YedYZ molybdopterin-dependent catalytic subunit
VPPGTISYARSLPRDKALQQEVLIAYEMNGRDLPPEHGYPVRAVVPGHYGMASVKWLTRILAVREPFGGYWETSDYGYWDDVDGQPVRRALGAMHLKSEIARPRAHETLAPNRVCPVSGAAWAGETDVTDIEVSTDGGRTWDRAEFVDPVQPFAWRRWRYEWLTPNEPGRCTLLARARGADGSVQPETHDAKYGGYVVHHPLPIDVFVAAGAGPSEA